MLCLAADTHLKLQDRVVRCQFLNCGCGVWPCTIVDLWRYYVCYKRSGKTRCTSLYCSAGVICASARYSRCCVRTSIHLCASLLQNLAVSHDCLYLSGTILLTPYSMVWDWRDSRAGPIPFYLPSC